jgi:hypothetical protein
MNSRRGGDFDLHYFLSGNVMPQLEPRRRGHDAAVIELF